MEAKSIFFQNSILFHSFILIMMFTLFKWQRSTLRSFTQLTTDRKLYSNKELKNNGFCVTTLNIWYFDIKKGFSWQKNI